jgi:hypothetical protein
LKRLSHLSYLSFAPFDGVHWTTMKLDPWSWMTAILSGIRNQEESLPIPSPGIAVSEHGLRGTLWSDAPDPMPSSVNAGAEVRICFRNRTDETVLLCWVGDNGTLHHFYALHPWHPKRQGGGDAITDKDHVETTVEGHVFLIVAAADVETIQKHNSLEGGVRVRRIGAFRADPGDAAEPGAMHLVEVVDPEMRPRTWGLLRNWNACCGPKRKWKDEDDEDTGALVDRYSRYILKARVLRITDEDVVDTTRKYYEAKLFGESRWPVMMEPKWYGRDRGLEQVLEQDVDNMARCLPPHAVTLLRETKPTPIWVNRTLKYGSKHCPVQGRGMCYHPGADWLREQGMHPVKCESVELYRASEYREMREYWGCGGIWLHEFSHAYHHKGCPDGYDNAEIQRCFEAAMKEGLYDSVRVHGPQGPTARAYACTNAMEYFAELSTAFLGGVAPKADDTDRRNKVNYPEEEFNKWYPFNRQQIREHDPRAYKLLKKIWKVDDA